MGGDGHRLDAVLAQRGDGECAEALGQRLAVLADQKAVVGERGRCGAQRFEQGDLYAGVGHVILAADDVRDGEVDVVDDAGERVEERSVGADQYGIGQ